MSDPAPIVVACPGCGVRAKVPAELVGRTLRCPRCARTFRAARRPEPAPTLPEVSRAGPDAPAVAQVAGRARGAPPTVAEAAEARAAPADWRPGDVLFGLYEVLGLLGQGGMGRVYRVRHPGWQLDLAAKVPLGTMLAAGHADSIEREAETWVNLGLHPHVVSCFYVRRLEGVPLVFVEYVDGGSLRDWIAARRLTSLEAVLDATIQVAWGLHYAHEQGLVHLDVKPANVMMTSEGVAKVTDFGLARARGGAGLAPLPQEARGGHTLTVEGAQGGTPAYASPEQFTAATLTRRSDTWSWALCLLEMFEGERTWEYGRAASALLDEYLKRGPAPGLPAMPEAVSELLRRCFRDAPEERPRTLLEAADVLQSAYESTTGSPYPRRPPRAARSDADNLNNRAVSLLDLGRRAEAEGLWQRALEAQPHHVEATYNAALSAWSRGELADDEALRRVGEACATNRNEPRAHQMLGRFHFALGDGAQATKAFEDALRLGAQGADFERERGLSLLMASGAGDGAGAGNALECFERALGKGSKDAVDVAGYALALARLGESERARGFYAQAVAGRGDLPRDLATAAAAQLPRHEAGTSLRGLREAAHSLVVTPDGSLVIAGSGNQVRVWDAHTGAHLRTLASADPRLYALAVTLDSRQLICTGEHGEQVWDLGSGMPVRSWPRHTGHSLALALTPDGGHVVCGGSDRLVRVCDVGSGECSTTLEGHQGAVTCVAVGSRRAVSGSRDGTLRVWDLESGRALGVLSGHQGRVNAVLLMEDPPSAVSAGDDRTVRVWDLGNDRLAATLAVHTQAVTSLAAGPRGRVLSGSLDGSVRAWDPVAGRLHALVRMDAAVTALASSGPAKLWAAHGTGVSTLSFPERARLPAFALARPVTAGEVEERVAAFAESVGAARQSLERGEYARALELARTARSVPGHERAAEAVELWDQICAQLPRKGVQSAWEERRLEGHGDRVLCVAVARSGDRALSGGLDGSLRLWNLAGPEPLAALPGHPPAVSAVAFLPDGASAVSAGRDRCLRLWHVASGRSTGSFEGHEDYVTSVDVSPDGSQLVSGSLDQGVRLWLVASGASRVFEGHSSSVAGVAFSPDGRFVISAGWDGVLCAWDVGSGVCVCRLEGHEGSVTAVAVGPTGRQVASGGQDATVRLWDLRARRCIRVLTGHTAEVTGLAFSPDGRHLGSASRDGTLRIWTVQTGGTERSMPHPGPVLCLAFTRMGSGLLTGCADRIVRAWHLDWEPEPRTAPWDEKARPFVETFVSIRLKPETVRERVAEALNEREVDTLLADLRHRGFGGLKREALLGQLRGLAEKPQVSYWDEVRSAAPPARITLPAPRRLPWKLMAAGAVVVAAVALAFVAWVRPQPKLLVLRFMAKDVKAQYDLIDLDSFRAPCDSGDYRAYLGLAWEREVSAPTLACLAGFRNPGTVGDYLSGATLRDPKDGLHDRRLFRNALSLMVGLGDVGSLCSRLADPDPDARRLAAMSLALMERADATGCLRDALGGSNPLAREGVTTVVPHLLANGQLGVTEGWMLLRERAHDREPAVRRAALRAHTMFTPELAARAVSEAVGDPDTEVAATARETLAHIEGLRKRRFIEGEN